MAVLCTGVLSQLQFVVILTRSNLVRDVFCGQDHEVVEKLLVSCIMFKDFVLTRKYK